MRISELQLPKGTAVRRAQVVVEGRVVALLSPRSPGVSVSFATRQERYPVALRVTLTNGKRLARTIVFRQCRATTG